MDDDHENSVLSQMEDFNSALPFVPIVLIFCAIIIGWIFLAKIFRQYNKLTFEMRKWDEPHSYPYKDGGSRLTHA